MGMVSYLEQTKQQRKLDKSNTFEYAVNPEG